jgi:hypothetical protein
LWSQRKTTGKPRRKGDRLLDFGTRRVALKGIGRCITSSFYSPGSLLVGTAKLERERHYREETPLARSRFIIPKDVRQRSLVSSLFAERAITFVLLIPQQRARSQ